MQDYSKLIQALRCKRDDCEGCDLAFFDNDEGWICQYAAKDDDSADAIEALMKINNRFRELLDHRNKDVAELTTEIGELEAKNKELHGRIEEKELQIDMLTADNTNCDIAIDKLKAEVKKAAKRNAELHAELEKWVSAAEKAGEPKRGKWIGVSPMVDTVQCSICGGQLFSAELETPYCPYCGAKMEVQDGQE